MKNFVIYLNFFDFWANKKTTKKRGFISKESAYGKAISNAFFRGFRQFQKVWIILMLIITVDLANY